MTLMEALFTQAPIQNHYDDVIPSHFIVTDVSHASYDFIQILYYIRRYPKSVSSVHPSSVSDPSHWYSLHLAEHRS